MINIVFLNLDHKVVQQVVDEYDQEHRGSELPGFSNYRVFQHVVQKLVAELKRPAMSTLQKIRGKWPKPMVMSTPSLPLWRFLSPVYSLVRTPVTIVTRTCASNSSGLHHLPDYLPYFCHSLWFFPHALLFLFCVSVCTTHVSCFVSCWFVYSIHFLYLLPVY